MSPLSIELNSKLKEIKKNSEFNGSPLDVIRLINYFIEKIMENLPQVEGATKEQIE